METRIRAYQPKKYVREKVKSEWLKLANHLVKDGCLIALIIKFKPQGDWENNTKDGQSKEAVYAHNINRNSKLRHKVKAGTSDIDGNKNYSSRKEKYIKLTFLKPIQVEDDKKKIAAKADEEFFSFCKLIDGVASAPPTAFENIIIPSSPPSLGDKEIENETQLFFDDQIPHDSSDLDLSELDIFEDDQELQPDVMTNIQEVKKSEVEHDGSLEFFRAIDQSILDFQSKEITLKPISEFPEISFLNEFNKRSAENNPEHSEYESPAKQSKGSS